MNKTVNTPHAAYCILIAAFFIFNFQFSILNCSAQSKFGHVDYSTILTNMNGIDSIQTIVLNFRTELQTIGEQMVKELEEKQAALEKLANDPKASQSVLKIRRDELLDLHKRFQEFQQTAELDLQEKQIEVMQPFQTKLSEAIKKVAKANNYNYIFDVTPTLLFYTATDDLTDKVKSELGIK